MSIAQAHALLTAPGSPLEMAEMEIRGIRTRVWKNQPPTLRELLMLARAQYGAREFLIYEDERATFESFYRAAVAIAEELQKRGVRKGDRVAIVMRNLPEWPAIFYGAGIIGRDRDAAECVVDGTGAGIRPDRFRRQDRLRRCRAAGAHRRAPGELPRRSKRVYVSRYPDELPNPLVQRLEDVDRHGQRMGKPAGSAAAGGIARTRRRRHHPLHLRHHGQAQGRARHPSQHAVEHHGLGVFGGAQFPAPRRDAADPQPEAIRSAATLLSVPFFHATGCFAILNPSVASGGKIVLMRKWDAESAMQLIEREKINGAGGVPTIAWQLIEHPSRDKYDLSSLEAVAYGGAPSAPELVRKIKEAFPKSLPGNGWGMTETSRHLHQQLRRGLRAPARLLRPGGAGRAI